MAVVKINALAEQRWFVYSRWADEESYQAWRTGDAFAQGHGGAQSSADAEGEQRPAPVSTGSTLLEFEVKLSRSA